MARNEMVECAVDTWVQLTNADATSITFMVRDGEEVYIAGTVGAVAPSDFDSSLLYRNGQGERNANLTDLFPGIAATRVYARATTDEANIFVSHG